MVDGAPTTWERVQIARHPGRPRTLDFIAQLCDHFIELHGDRQFHDDRAMVGGLATFRGKSIVVIGHQKGSDTRENLERNFGMARPEGYRKALRLMRHAAKFDIPLVTFVDTPGADPGTSSEEHGQPFAIAECIYALAELPVPVVTLVVGEGGSGGALGIGLADRILMLENAIYSVASPEASASILWKDAGQAPAAAEAMRITAAELHNLGIIDEVIPEPFPAHENPAPIISAAGDAIARHLQTLIATANHGDTGIQEMLDARLAKYRNIGEWREIASG